jgi:hypothetical protein
MAVVSGAASTAVYVIQDLRTDFVSTMDISMSLPASIQLLGPVAVAFGAAWGRSLALSPEHDLYASSPTGTRSLKVLRGMGLAMSFMFAYVAVTAAAVAYAVVNDVHWNGWAPVWITPLFSLPLLVATAFLLGARLPWRVLPFLLLVVVYILLIVPLYSDSVWAGAWLVNDAGTTPWSQPKWAGTSGYILVHLSALGVVVAWARIRGIAQQACAVASCLLVIGFALWLFRAPGGGEVVEAGPGPRSIHICAASKQTVCLHPAYAEVDGEANILARAINMRARAVGLPQARFEQTPIVFGDTRQGRVPVQIYSASAVDVENSFIEGLYTVLSRSCTDAGTYPQQAEFLSVWLVDGDDET